MPRHFASRKTPAAPRRPVSSTGSGVPGLAWLILGLFAMLAAAFIAAGAVADAFEAVAAAPDWPRFPTA